MFYLLKYQLEGGGGVLRYLPCGLQIQWRNFSEGDLSKFWSVRGSCPVPPFPLGETHAMG